MDAICVSWNQALERLAPQYAGTVTRERLQPCMGMLLPDILNRLVPELDQEKMQPVLDQILAEENRYVAEYGGILFPGEEEVLASLSGRYRLFIVSNCQDGYIEAFFQAHGLGKYFADFENPGRTGLPKADNIALVVERNGLRRPLYIGDTQGDLLTGQCPGRKPSGTSPPPWPHWKPKPPRRTRRPKPRTICFRINAKVHPLRRTSARAQATVTALIFRRHGTDGGPAGAPGTAQRPSRLAG